MRWRRRQDLTGIITSPHLTSGSLIHIQLAIIPSKKAKIIEIKALIKEAFAVHYAPTKVVCPPPIRHTLLAVSSHFTIPGYQEEIKQTSDLAMRVPPREKRHSELAALPFPLPLRPHQESKVDFIVRAPTSSTSSPTTLHGTHTKIRVSHLVLVRVHYRVWESRFEAGGVDGWGPTLAVEIGTDVVIGAVSLASQNLCQQ